MSAQESARSHSAAAHGEAVREAVEESCAARATDPDYTIIRGIPAFAPAVNALDALELAVKALKRSEAMLRERGDANDAECIADARGVAGSAARMLRAVLDSIASEANVAGGS